jgi:hypothetical protein
VAKPCVCLPDNLLRRDNPILLELTGEVGQWLDNNNLREKAGSLSRRPPQSYSHMYYINSDDLSVRLGISVLQFRDGYHWGGGGSIPNSMGA